MRVYLHLAIICALLFSVCATRSSAQVYIGCAGVGQSTSQTLTLYASGSPLVVTDVEIIGDNNVNFKITEDNLTGHTFNPGDSGTITIQFAPLEKGKKKATLTGHCTSLSGGSCTFGSVDITGGADVTIQKVVSNQLEFVSPNQCNFVDRGGLRLFMGTVIANDGSSVAPITVTAMVDPPDALPDVMIGVRLAGDETILNTTAGNLDTTGSVDLEFEPSGSALFDSNVYQVIAYCEPDGHSPKAGEELDIFNPNPTKQTPIRVVTQEDYDFSVGTLDVLNSELLGQNLPVASALLNAFVHNVQPPGTTKSTFTLTLAELSGASDHPVGALWDANCEDTTAVKYTYPITSDLSKSTAKDFSSSVKGAINPTINSWFKSHNASTYSFSMPFSFVYTSSELFSPDLFFAFGHIKTQGTATGVARRTAFGYWYFSSLHFTGSFDDLFKAYFLGAFPSRYAAVVQAGYPTLGSGGHVFDTHVEYSSP